MGLFSEHSDVADAEKFIESLKDKKFDHPDVATIHTVLFSMSGDEWEQSGFEPGDYQKMIRHIMSEYEIRTGHKVEWVAAEHRNPDHPHVHLVLRAAYKDRDGIERRLKISNEDRKWFREQFQKTKEIYRPFDPPPREYDLYKDRQPNFHVDTTFLDNFFYQVKKDLEHEEWERELAKKKAQNKERTR